MPDPSPMPAGPPTTADVARAILPGVRIAARAKYGRGVRMAVLGPLLPILIQLVAHFLMKWLMDRQENNMHSLELDVMEIAGAWERDRPYEVQMAMTRAAAGETGE